MIIVATKRNLEDLISTDKEIKVPTFEDYIHMRSASHSLGWHPARPTNVDSYWDRIKQAYLVLTGKADVITWIGQ